MEWVGAETGGSLRLEGRAILLRGRDRVYPLEDVERTLTSLKDVRSAKIVPDRDGAIQEVHVVAVSGRAAKQIARDVESMLVAKLGITVDHRKVSIAQVDEGGPESVGTPASLAAPIEPAESLRIPYLAPRESRIEFIGVSVAQSHQKAEARVELALDGAETVAAADGLDSADSVLRIVSEATLTAVQQFLVDRSAFSVSAVEQCMVGGRPLVVVSVCHVSQRQEKLLVGACSVNGDLTRAAALATLDAVNRFLRRLPRKEPVEYEVGPAMESENA